MKEQMLSARAAIRALYKNDLASVYINCEFNNWFDINIGVFLVYQPHTKRVDNLSKRQFSKIFKMHEKSIWIHI